MKDCCVSKCTWKTTKPRPMFVSQYSSYPSKTRITYYIAICIQLAHSLQRLLPWYKTYNGACGCILLALMNLYISNQLTDFSNNSIHCPLFICQEKCILALHSHQTPGKKIALSQNSRIQSHPDNVEKFNTLGSPSTTQTDLAGGEGNPSSSAWALHLPHLHHNVHTCQEVDIPLLHLWSLESKLLWQIKPESFQGPVIFTITTKANSDVAPAHENEGVFSGEALKRKFTVKPISG